jgi:hypothetical protein
MTKNVSLKEKKITVHEDYFNALIHGGEYDCI